MPEYTLLLRLAGPMQAWGLSGQFVTRDTATQPTKSGVVGLLAAALGRPRGEDIEDLAALRFGVRADQPGIVMRDYHTISRFTGEPIPAASGAKAVTNITKVTERDYLADAVFVVGLSGDQGGADLLRTLDYAVEHPAYPLSLGRRSCPPQGRISLGVVDAPLVDALTSTEWQGPSFGRPAGKVRLSVEDAMGSDIVNDVPTNFDPFRRSFDSRRVEHLWVSVPATAPPESAEEPGGAPAAASDPHDPFALLGW